MYWHFGIEYPKVLKFSKLIRWLIIKLITFSVFDSEKVQKLTIPNLFSLILNLGYFYNPKLFHDRGPNHIETSPLIDLQSKSMDWFLYDSDLRHEKVRSISKPLFFWYFQGLQKETSSMKWVNHFINNVEKWPKIL